MDIKLAEEILNKTIEDYNKIAEDWSMTRQHISPDILNLRKYYTKNMTVLDLGCGNGRLAEMINYEDYFGVDTSSELINIAKKRYPNHRFLASKPLEIPFENNYFDLIFSLAVIHHIPSKELRQKFFTEIYRVLTPNGRLIITAWNLWYERKIVLKIINNNICKILGINKLDFNDFEIPFFGKKSNRFLHAFTIESLANELKTAGFKVEKKSINFRNKNRTNKKHYNIEIIAKKR